MRRIEFRAWDTKLKTIRSNVPVMNGEYLKVDLTRNLERVEAGLSTHDFPLMQFTGLQDKWGVDIFEGHILESRASENEKDWKRWICVFQDGSFCFEAEAGKKKRKYEQNLLCEDNIDLYGLVIIGTIYLHPELMEEKSWNHPHPEANQLHAAP